MDIVYHVNKSMVKRVKYVMKTNVYKINSNMINDSPNDSKIFKFILYLHCKFIKNRFLKIFN